MNGGNEVEASVYSDAENAIVVYQSNMMKLVS